MNTTRPIFDTTTHYRIELQGRVDQEWLQSFDNPAMIQIDESSPRENSTVLSVRADQAGIVGLLRRLHGLGMTIVQLEIDSSDRDLDSS